MASSFHLFETLESRRLLSVSYTPAQIQAAYGFNQISFDNGTIPGNGAGQTIALIEVDNDLTLNTDLANFDSTFNLPAPGPSSWSLTVTGQTGTYLPTNTATPVEDAETSLDVEWAHAIAPAANILVVEANSSFDSDLNPAIYYAQSVKGVSVISMSYTRDELASDIFSNGNYSTPDMHTGITYVAASGDAGIVSHPSSSPFVVGVGGTSLTLVNGTYGSETAWSGSGGGYSTVQPEPAFQAAAQNSGQRATPDVSYDADPNTGFDFFYDGDPQAYIVGGTSAGAPQWAALFAIADQGRALNGLGTLDSSADDSSNTLSMLYALYDTPLYDSAFHDITSGGNSGYSATEGYDPVTGLGSPQANVLVQYLAGNISIPEPATFIMAMAAVPVLLQRPRRPMNNSHSHQSTCIRKHSPRN